MAKSPPRAEEETTSNRSCNCAHCRFESGLYYQGIPDGEGIWLTNAFLFVTGSRMVGTSITRSGTENPGGCLFNLRANDHVEGHEVLPAPPCASSSVLEQSLFKGIRSEVRFLPRVPIFGICRLKRRLCALYTGNCNVQIICVRIKSIAR